MYVGVEQGTKKTNEMKMIKYLQNENESVFFCVRLLIGDHAIVLSDLHKCSRAIQGKFQLS